MSLYHFPHNLVVDIAVFVSKNMTLADNSRPWEFRMGLPKFIRDFSGGFPDDLYLALDGCLQDFIGKLIVETSVRNEPEDRALCFEHVP
jgi:hypothetical protein